ncbi:MAG: DNA adenine methylase [bacterium]|nr:DNA adenine methylase [bacterium]
MKTFIKWAGGKEKELPFIMSNLPQQFNRYIEPFVGGGAVYFAIDKKKSIINDKSEELINLYKFIQCGNKEFLSKIEELYHNWCLLEKVIINNSKELLNLYKNYCNEENVNKYTKIKYNDKICDFVIRHAEEFNGVLTEQFNIKIDNFIHEIQKNLYSKIYRMNKIEKIKGLLSDESILDNMESSLKSAFYMHFRYLYNYKNELKINEEFSSAIFYFIREYCYASMFRYNKQGKFNVPYGGISYNRKDFNKKIEYLKSNEIKNYMSDTKIYNLDFEDFCNKIRLSSNDFMFLDPPYDTEFSTYAKNDFNKNDQVRLANYLKNTKAKFMLVIKNTEFIYNLYNVKGFYIKSFDKKYLVSFQNRNNKDVEHLIITNYDMGE